MSDKKELQSRKMFNYVLKQMKQGSEWVEISDVKEQHFYDESAFKGMKDNGENGCVYVNETAKVEKGKHKPAFIFDDTDSLVTIPKCNLVDCAEAMPELK